jgi:hypothetical protein
MASASEEITSAAAASRLLPSLATCEARLVADEEHLAEGRKDWLERFERGPGAGHHHGERAFARALDAAADRSIDPLDAAPGEALGYPCRGARPGGREVDHGSDAGAVCNPGLAERYPMEDVRGRQAGHHDFGRGGDLGRRASRRRPSLDHGSDSVLADVEDGDRMPGLEQTADHRAAHPAEPDESEIPTWLRHPSVPHCAPKRQSRSDRTPSGVGRARAGAIAEATPR